MWYLLLIGLEISILFVAHTRIGCFKIPPRHVHPGEDGRISNIKNLGSWDNVKRAYDQDPQIMREHVRFRRKYVLDTLVELQVANLQIMWPEPIPGGTTLTSDFDVPIWVRPGAEISHWADDVRAARAFAAKIKHIFGEFSGSILDTNIYVQQFSPIGSRSSLVDKSNQAVAALLKVRRYMDTDQWESLTQNVRDFSDAANNKNNDEAAQTRFEHSMYNLDEADTKSLLMTRKLYDRLQKNDRGRVASELPLQILNIDDAVRRMSDFIAGCDPRLVLETEYNLFLDGMQEVRKMQIERLIFRPDISEDEIRQKSAEAGFFAPEGASSDGAFRHIVLYEQSGRTVEVWKKLTHFDLYCSAVEQAGEYLKDVNFHYLNDPETGIYESSKYLIRFYDAVELLHKKIGEEGEATYEPGLPERRQRKISPPCRFKLAAQELFHIRKENIPRRSKIERAEAVMHNDETSNLFGGDIGQFQATVQEHLAQVMATYQRLFDTRPE